MKTVAVKAKKLAGASRISGVDDRTLDYVTEIFKSVADRSRLLILMILAQQGETHVSAICKLLSQSQPAVSHHLTQLRNAGLISFRRDGKYNYYAIDSNHVGELLAKFFPGPASTTHRLPFGELEIAFKVK